MCRVLRRSSRGYGDWLVGWRRKLFQPLFQFGNLLLDTSKLIVVGSGLLLLRLLHGGEINSDGLKLLLEF